jgi:hypothetical protein
MVQEQNASDRILDAGMKIGFLIMVVGIIMFYLPMFETTMDITFDYIQFWEMFRTFPEWVQVIMGGIMFVGLAFIVGVGKELVEKMVQSLFGRETDF